jgi:hypothetical protein
VSEPSVEPDEVHFRARPQARRRKGLMLFVVAGLAGWAILNGRSSGFDAPLLITVVVLLVLFGIFFGVQQLSNPGDGEIVMTITDSAIEAERFTTAEKRFLWTEILGGRVYRYEGNTYLELRVIATPSRPDRFSLAMGVNLCVPTFALDVLGGADRKKLLALLKERTDLHT